MSNSIHGKGLNASRSQLVEDYRRVSDAILTHALTQRLSAANPTIDVYMDVASLAETSRFDAPQRSNKTVPITVAYNKPEPTTPPTTMLWLDANPHSNTYKVCFQSLPDGTTWTPVLSYGELSNSDDSTPNEIVGGASGTGPAPDPNTDEQTLSLSGNEISISGGNSIDLTDLLAGLKDPIVEIVTPPNDTGNSIGKITVGGVAFEIKETLTKLELVTGPGKADLTYTDEAETDTVIDLVAVIKANETVTALGTPTWDSVTGELVLPYTDETGTETTKTCNILPVFVNTDNQQLTGDTTGSVEFTLTPVDDGGVTNYTLKGEVKVDGTTVVIDPVTHQISADVKGNETLTKLALSGDKLTYTDETDTDTVLTLPSGGGTPAEETVTTFTSVLSDGFKLGTYTNESLTVVDLYAPSDWANTATVEGATHTATNTVNTAVTTAVTGTNTEFLVKASLPRAGFAPNNLNNGLQYDAALGGWYADAPESAFVRMSIPPGAQQAVPTTVSAASPLKVTVSAAVQVGNSSMIITDVGNSRVLLKAGYDYELTAYLSADVPAGNSLSFQFMRSTDLVTPGVGTPTQLVGILRNTNGTLFSNFMPQVTWQAVVDTLFWLAAISSVGAGNKINNPAGAGTTGISWTVRMIGKSY